MNLDETFSLYRGSQDGFFAFNSFGQQEKWLKGKVNSFGNEFYILTSDNRLVEWDGSSAVSGNELATDLSPEVYENPLLLADAFADGSVLNGLTEDSLFDLGP